MRTAPSIAIRRPPHGVWGLLSPPLPLHLASPKPLSAAQVCCQLAFKGAVSFSDGRNDLPTAIRGPPPPRVAHSTPLGLLYLGTHALFCRAAGSVVAPGFAVPPRPSGACSEGVCTRLGGFPVPRRKAHGRGASARQPEKSPASWLAAFASCGWQRRLSSAAEAAPALLSLLLGRFSL